MTNLQSISFGRLSVLTISLALLVLAILATSEFQPRLPPVASPTELTLEEVEQRVQDLMMQFVTFPDGSEHRVLGTVVRTTESNPELGCYAVLQGRERAPCLEVLELAGRLAK